MSDAEEDLIESDEPSPTVHWFGRRLDQLLPARVGRRFLGAVTVTALALGLGAGYLVGAAPWNDGREGVGDSSTAADNELNNLIPLNIEEAVPSPGDGVIVYSTVGGLLTVEDLTALGELPLTSGLAGSSGLAGLCAAEPAATPTGADPGTENGAASGITFELADAWLSELVSPDLDVLAASTLRARVELAQSCGTSAFTAQTEGVETGIGDEYAAFTVRDTDPASGALSTGFVILVRVDSHLIEVFLAPTGDADLFDGLNRALRIAEAAVERMLTG